MPGSDTRAAVGSSSLIGYFLRSCRVLARLFDRRGVAGKGRAAHVADLIAVVEAAGTVHRLAVVPHHEIAGPPDMRIDEFALRRVLGQVAQEYARLGDRPALDGAGMRRQKQRFAAGYRVSPH